MAPPLPVGVGVGVAASPAPFPNITDDDATDADSLGRALQLSTRTSFSSN